MKYEVFQKGDVVFKNGDDKDINYYILLRGIVEIEKSKSIIEKEKLNPDNYEGMIFKEKIILRQGQGFGELALINKTKRQVTATCKKITECAVVSQKQFKTVMSMYKDYLFRKKLLFLNKFPILCDINEFEQVQILKHLKEKTFKFGETLYKQGDHFNCIYFIINGEVELLKNKDVEIDKPQQAIFDPKAGGLKHFTSNKKLIDPTKQNFQVSVAIYSDNSIVGDLELKDPNHIRQFTAKCYSTICKCYKLKLKNFYGNASLKKYMKFIEWGQQKYKQKNKFLSKYHKIKRRQISKIDQDKTKLKFRGVNQLQVKNSVKKLPQLKKMPLSQHLFEKQALKSFKVKLQTAQQQIEFHSNVKKVSDQSQEIPLNKVLRSGWVNFYDPRVTEKLRGYNESIYKQNPNKGKEIRGQYNNSVINKQAYKNQNVISNYLSKIRANEILRKLDVRSYKKYEKDNSYYYQLLNLKKAFSFNSDLRKIKGLRSSQPIKVKTLIPKMQINTQKYHISQDILQQYPIIWQQYSKRKSKYKYFDNTDNIPRRSVFQKRKALETILQKYSPRKKEIKLNSFIQSRKTQYGIYNPNTLLYPFKNRTLKFATPYIKKKKYAHTARLYK